MTSPSLPRAVTHDAETTIKRLVLEALAAVAAHDEGRETTHGSTVGFIGVDLGGHSGLSIAARAGAVADAISEYHALLG